jgi:hypothetical protein
LATNTIFRDHRIGILGLAFVDGEDQGVLEFFAIRFNGHRFGGWPQLDLGCMVWRPSAK